VLINRVIKRNLREKHQRDLHELYSQDQSGCREEIRRFWGDADTKDIVRCMEERDWDGLKALLPRLRAEVVLRRLVRQPLSAAFSLVMNSARRAYRFLRPNYGLHAVFLGPDGVGKSTVIDIVAKEIAPAFMGMGYQTFAPSILPKKFQPDKKLPHELPPRSLPASLLKACWWLVCYTVGYLFTVHTVRGRAGIVLCHRYLMDAIVDPKRYRYSGPIWLLKAIRFVTPKPDMVILLDAPAEVIQKRKQEVPLEETARQREDFRAVVEGHRNSHIVDASQPLAHTVEDVNDKIIAHLRSRLARRFRLGGRS
jgi:thymidylate kinase